MAELPPRRAALLFSCDPQQESSLWWRVREPGDDSNAGGPDLSTRRGHNRVRPVPSSDWSPRAARGARRPAWGRACALCAEGKGIQVPPWIAGVFPGVVCRHACRSARIWWWSGERKGPCAHVFGALGAGPSPLLKHLRRFAGGIRPSSFFGFEPTRCSAARPPPWSLIANTWRAPPSRPAASVARHLAGRLGVKRDPPPASGPAGEKFSDFPLGKGGFDLPAVRNDRGPRPRRGASVAALGLPTGPGDP